MPVGVAYFEFDEDGWSSRSVHVHGGRYFSSEGLEPLDVHPVLGDPMLSNQPLWSGMDLSAVFQISPEEFESAWRAAADPS